MAEWEIRFRDFIELKLESKADLLMLNEARRDLAAFMVAEEKRAAAYEDKLQHIRDTSDARLSSLEKWRSALAAIVALAVLSLPIAALLISPHL